MQKHTVGAIYLTVQFISLCNLCHAVSDISTQTILVGIIPGPQQERYNKFFSCSFSERP